MPKQFYTEKDIEDLFNTGTRSLQVTDQVVLTELAYEKAKQLGLQLLTDEADIPPAAPVRPYLSDGHSAIRPRTVPSPAAQALAQPAHSSSVVQDRSDPSARRSNEIEQRIRSAVKAKLGDQVEAKLLDNIIHRVVKGLGLK
jgi:hypothetical protein